MYSSSRHIHNWYISMYHCFQVKPAHESSTTWACSSLISRGTGNNHPEQSAETCSYLVQNSCALSTWWHDGRYWHARHALHARHLKYWPSSLSHQELVVPRLRCRHPRYSFFFWWHNCYQWTEQFVHRHAEYRQKPDCELFPEHVERGLGDRSCPTEQLKFGCSLTLSSQYLATSRSSRAPARFLVHGHY